MKTVFEFTIRWSALLFAGYLGIETVRRFFNDGAGDPLVPLGLLLIIIVSTAIFKICMDISEDILEIKRATAMFVSQSRSEIEFLQAFSNYLSLLTNSKGDEQKADLN